MAESGAQPRLAEGLLLWSGAQKGPGLALEEDSDVVKYEFGFFA